MTNTKPDVEILVHTTAPSKAQDDADYRALAAAYLSFETDARTDIGTLGLGRPGVLGTEGDAGSTDGVQKRRQDADLLMTQQSFGFNASNVSFGSVDHNLYSPRLRRSQGHVQQEITDSQSSWRAPPSVIADSIPDNNISIAQYCSPTRILEHYLQAWDSSQSSSSQAVPSVVAPSPSPVATRQVVSIPASQTPLAALARPLPPSSTSESSVIPQSPLVAVRKRARQELPPSALGETEVVASSIALPHPTLTHLSATVASAGGSIVIPSSAPAISHSRSLSLPVADLLPASGTEHEERPIHKRQKRLINEAVGSSLIRSSSDVGPRQDKAKTILLSQRRQTQRTSDGLEIRAPEPGVSCADLSASDVVTPRLEKLASDVKLEERFEQRKIQTRELRPFERGYWLVDCSGWSSDDKSMTWGFLTNYVGIGAAGWGIWCRRDEAFTWVRLYCWGSVAGHMYLVLYLASRRRLNYTKRVG